MIDHPSYSILKVGKNNFLDLPGPENIYTVYRVGQKGLFVFFRKLLRKNPNERFWPTQYYYYSRYVTTLSFLKEMYQQIQSRIRIKELGNLQVCRYLRI